MTREGLANQQRRYRRMIKRLGTDVPLEKRPPKIALWHALGEIYRSRLKDFPRRRRGVRGVRPVGAPKTCRATRILAELSKCRVRRPTTRPCVSGA